MDAPPLTGHENWGGRWEKQAILTCRDGGHRQTQVHCAHVSTVRLEPLLHALLAALTNWSHQYTSGVGPNNTCVLASLSTGEASFVDAKVHSRPRLSVSYLVVNQCTPGTVFTKHHSIHIHPLQRSEPCCVGAAASQSVSAGVVATRGVLFSSEASEHNSVFLFAIKVDCQRTVLGSGGQRWSGNNGVREHERGYVRT